MTANGFLEQRTARPVSFGAVVLLHGAAIAAVLLVKGPGWIQVPDKPLIATEVQLRPPPPPELPPTPIDQQTPNVPTISRIDVPPRVIPTPVPSIPMSGDPIEPSTAIIGSGTLPASGTGTRPEPRIEPRPEVPPRDLRPPVRVDSQFDPRFAGALQPPYPAAEERNDREGTVRVRVTIGADGRVKAAERVSATSDAFWLATQRHALNRWRFKPATVDGRPVESSKVLSIKFELRGQ
jgi:protein TonB